MKKVWITIGLVIVAGGALGIYFFTKHKPTDTNQTVIIQQQKTETQQPEAAPKTNTPGKYIAFSDSASANTSGTKLLFFHAPWCPQCRALDESINKGPIPDNVTIFKVDYDSNQELRKKYGVTLQTTIVKIDDQGNLVKKYVAYEQPTIEAVKNNLL